MRKKSKVWESLSIKNKIHIFIGAMMFTTLMFIILTGCMLRFTLVEFHGIMEGNNVSSELADALEQEKKDFEAYIKNSNSTKQEALKKSMEETKYCMDQLPYDYESQGKEIYRLTWNIQNAYEIYVEHRNMMLRRGDDIPNYVAELYSIYDMQDYLMDYIRALNNENVYAGKAAYFRLYPKIILGSAIAGIVVLMAIIGLLKLSEMVNQAIVRPLEELAEASRKIAENEFYISDIQVENQDEVGELVSSFNRMKNAMGNYAHAVEENRIAQKQLHEHELERVEMERRLENARIKMLVSQMNPHFLFNTLNVIAGMANLENADITEQMTRSLSNLLRYTVHNDFSVVPLRREIEVVKEYNYLQHMRFGARIRFEIDCRVDMDAYEIPPFTFQPLIENAIIHGVSPKIEGGKIRLRICVRGDYLVILIADNGIGMSRERLEEVRRGIHADEDEQIGIAVRNIYKRIKSIYSDSSMEIFSKENAGTLVRIQVPVKEAACIGY